MRRMLMAAMPVVIVALTALANAQDLAGFVVSSIKPNASGLPYSQSRDRADGLAIVNEPLRDIITFAFDLYDFQLTGAPDWAANERFDITARADQALRSTGSAHASSACWRIASHCASTPGRASRRPTPWFKAKGRAGAGLKPRDCSVPGIANLPCGAGLRPRMAASCAWPGCQSPADRIRGRGDRSRRD